MWSFAFSVVALIALSAVNVQVVVGDTSLAMPRNLASKTKTDKTKAMKKTKKTKSAAPMTPTADECSQVDAELVNQQIMLQAFEAADELEFFEPDWVQRNILDINEGLGIEEPGFTYDDVVSGQSFVESEIAEAVKILSENEEEDAEEGTLDLNYFMTAFSANLDPAMETKKIMSQIEGIVAQMKISELDLSPNSESTNFVSTYEIQSFDEQLQSLQLESNESDECTQAVVGVLIEALVLLFTFLGGPKRIAEKMGNEILFLLLVRQGVAHFKNFFKRYFATFNILLIAVGIVLLVLDLVTIVGVDTIARLLRGMLGWWGFLGLGVLILSQLAIYSAGSPAAASVRVYSLRSAIAGVVLQVGAMVNRCFGVGPRNDPNL